MLDKRYSHDTIRLLTSPSELMSPLNTTERADLIHDMVDAIGLAQPHHGTPEDLKARKIQLADHHSKRMVELGFTPDMIREIGHHVDAFSATTASRIRENFAVFFDHAKSPRPVSSVLD